MIEEFKEKTGVVFNDADLLAQAFTHRSYVNEHPELEYGHNERLEFLGDAVVELVVTEYLYNKYPDKPEGEMTNFRAALVNTGMFARVARENGYNDIIRLSRGEAKDEGRARDSILADTFEAVIGALYIDQGYDATKAFIEKILVPKVGEIVSKNLWRDPKSSFQEAAQEHVGVTPTYKVLKEEGPDHSKHFVVGVYIAGKQVAEGEGLSKQEAEVKAAEKGLKEKGW